MAQLTQVTIHYGLTQSLPDYCNTKPGLTLSATLDLDDDAHEVMRTLYTLARHEVEAQVDEALEAAGRSARYSMEPRYRVVRSYPERRSHVAGTTIVVAILPADMRLDHVDDLRFYDTSSTGDSRGLRYTHALKVAQATVDDVVEQEQRAIVVDCSAGDEVALVALAQAVKDATPVEQVVASSVG